MATTVVQVTDHCSAPPRFGGMLRSPRLEVLFGKRLDQVAFADVAALVGREEAAEAADLDYKEQVHAKDDQQKVEFCKDVVALANDRGGVLIIGVREDGTRAIPEKVTKVDVTDAEQRRLRDVLLNTAPHPLPVDIKPLEDPGDIGRGVLLVMVERSALAPHALLDTRDKTHHRDGWLRFPIRNGAATRWMLEPEITTRYRQRFAQAGAVADRLNSVEHQAFSDYVSRVLELTADRSYDPLGPRPLPVLTVVLAPELPGFLRINRETFKDFQRAQGGRFLHAPSEMAFDETWLASGWLGGAKGGSATKWYAELHTDGSGVLVFNLNPYPASSNQLENTRAPLGLTMAYLLSALQLLGRHARDRASAFGTAMIRIRLNADIQDTHDAQLSFTDSQGFMAGQSIREAHGDATVFIDDVADDGADLVAAAALLADQAVNGLGLPETGLFTADGRIPVAPWAAHRDVVTWARGAGVVLE
jgi:schlafen family protein